MTGSTSVPSLTFTNAGFVAPSESAILTGIEADLNSAFGGNLLFDGSTPEDQIAASETAIVGDANNQMLSVFNGVDPAVATGRLQDGIGRIYFLTRNPATSTVVACTCTGAPTTVIKAGAIAQDTNSNLYYSTANGTISGGGTVTINFACATTGPIACPAGALNQIYSGPGGWNSVVNPADGIPGSNVETAQQFEARRQSAVEGNSFGSIGAIIGAVAKVPNVLDYWGYSNNTSGTVTVSGVSIAANAIYISVEGGTDADVAQAILSKKGPGAPMGGNTTVTAYDSNPLFSVPIAYSITFERPSNLTFLCKVTIKNNNFTPSNAASLIGSAISSAFAGQINGVPRARIGTTYYALQLLPSVNALWPGIEVIGISLGTAQNTSAAFTASISGTNLTVTAIASGTITPGMQIIYQAGLADGTYIVSQTSGTTGGTGVYVVNNSQTFASGTMTAYVASDTFEAINASQVPSLNSHNVATVFA